MEIWNINYQTLILYIKRKILEKIKNANYHDLEDSVYRMELTYDEIMDVLDKNYFPSRRTGYALPPGIYEISGINKTLELLLPDFVKVNITVDDNRLRSNLKINQTLISNRKNLFFNTILAFTQSQSGPLNDIEGFIQLIPVTYKSDKPINITGVDKVL